MEKNWFVLFLCVFVGVFFSGCSCTGGALCPNTYKKPETLHLKQIFFADKEEKLNIFVDDTLDLARNKLFIEGMVEVINRHGKWSDVYNTSVNQVNFIEDFYEENNLRRNAYLNKDFYNSYFVKITMDHYAPIGNYVMKNISYNSTGIFTSVDKHESNTYFAKKLDDRRFEISGFKNRQEALDLYLYIVDSTLRFAFDEDLTETIQKIFVEKNIDYLNPLKYYGGMALEFDPIVLKDENRLILKSTLDYFSLSNLLKKEMSDNYNFVATAEEADLVMVVNNLAFICPYTTKEEHLKVIQTKEYEGKIFEGAKASNHLYNSGSALHSLSLNGYMSPKAAAASNTIASAELAIGLIGAFTGPNKTQSRLALHKVYFIKPSGEFLAEKVYGKNYTFNQGFLKNFYFNLAIAANLEIIKSIYADIEH
ncbi:MAG: hypothetical protein IBX45_13095 [Campylobacterales bacterium]|nr:hypothetical protein [Campylobacterales bacterium]